MGYSPLHVAEGGNVTVSCNVETNPPASVWWQLEGDNSVFINGTELVITNIDRNQSGGYSCYASSERMRDNGSIEVFTSNKTLFVDVQCKLELYSCVL